MTAWLSRWALGDLWVPIWPNLAASALWALPGLVVLLRRQAAHHRSVHARLDAQDRQLRDIHRAALPHLHQEDQ